MRSSRKGTSGRLTLSRQVDLRGVERACLSGDVSLGTVRADRRRCVGAGLKPAPTDEQGLNPAQVVTDGASAIAKGAAVVWPAARLSHDINHVRRVLDQLVHQIEQSAYRALEKAEEALARLVRREGAATPQALRKLEWRMADTYDAQEAAIDLAERVRLAVEQAHGALNIVNPSTGRVNTVAAAQATLSSRSPNSFGRSKRRTGAKLYATCAGLPSSWWSKGSATWRSFSEIASEHQQSLARKSRRRRVCKELDKQHRAANWSGTREQLHRQMLTTWRFVLTQAQKKAQAVVE